jgi:predicted RNA-binding protein with PIN domain
MILLIDGYNVINRVPELRPSLEGGLENARLTLALRTSTWHQTHQAYECVIVFDGDARYAGGPDQRLAGVRCLFSRASHGGDDEIIRLVRDYKERGSDVTVVSDDNKVANNCRALGATIRPSSFIVGVRAGSPPPARARSVTRADDGKGLDRKAAAKISEELRKKFGLR